MGKVRYRWEKQYFPYKGGYGMLAEFVFLLGLNLWVSGPVSGSGVGERLYNSAGCLLEAKKHLEDFKRLWSLREKHQAMMALRKATSLVWEAGYYIRPVAYYPKKKDGEEKHPPDMPLEIRYCLEKPDPGWFSQHVKEVLCAKVIVHNIEDIVGGRVKALKEELKEILDKKKYVGKNWYSIYSDMRILGQEILKRAIAKEFLVNMEIKESFVLKRRKSTYREGCSCFRAVKNKKRIYGEYVLYKYIHSQASIMAGKSYWIIGLGPFYGREITDFNPSVGIYSIKKVIPAVLSKERKYNIINPKIILLERKICGVLEVMESIDAEKGVDGLPQKVSKCLDSLEHCISLEKEVIGEKMWSSTISMLQNGIPDEIKWFCMRNPFFRKGCLSLVFAKVLFSYRLNLFVNGPSGKGVFLLVGKIGRIVKIKSKEGDNEIPQGLKFSVGSRIKMIPISGVSEVGAEKWGWFLLRPPCKLPVRVGQVPNGGDQVFFVVRCWPSPKK